jgi:cobalt-zinc-cadmium efflux system membrane fusion protein
VLCEVYQHDLGEVHVGDSAEIRLNAYPGQVFKGPIADISRVLDPSTRSAKVRIVLANGNGLLRPGMFAAATFRSRRAQPRLVLPVTAVMRLQDKDWIFRKEGNCFRRLEVQSLGEMEGGMVQVQGAANAGSLNAGDQVVAAALAFSTEMAGQGK